MIAPDGHLDVWPLLSALTHRGPNGSGVHADGKAAIGATRLAIRDADAGGQPMADADSGVAVVFNGEIYNDAALRAELAARGHRFRTRCDTETVMRGWVEWGAGLLPRLDGMFALAVLEAGRLTLARDPVGIKPLFHTRGGRDGPFLFASEIPALLRHPSIPRSLNACAFADFVALGYPTGTETFFDGVATLEPGHLLSVEWTNGWTQRSERFCFDDDPSMGELSENSAQFSAAIKAAVISHRAADSPPALALSGGLDSAVLAFLAAEHGAPPTCFTVSDSTLHPDALAAGLVACAIGADHRLRICDFDAYLGAIPATLAAVAMPDLGPGPLFLRLSQAIGEHHKVALNGEGADETLCGYAAYADADGTMGELNAGFARAAAAGLVPSLRAFDIRDRLAEAAGDAMAFRAALRGEYLREQLVRCHLEPVDHLSMAASVEMRVPFLDRAVQRWGAGASGDGRLEMALGIRKRTLRRFALERFGAPILDVVLRDKLQMPDAGRSHVSRFAALAEKMVDEPMLRGSPLAPAFPDKASFLVFELFRHIHLTGKLAANDDLQAALPDLVGAA